MAFARFFNNDVKKPKQAMLPSCHVAMTGHQMLWVPLGGMLRPAQDSEADECPWTAVPLLEGLRSWSGVHAL